MLKNRSRALDIFRGLAVAFMILINNPGLWSSVYGPFKHSVWHGLTAADVVFPFFLFAVGNALFMTSPTLSKIFKRSLVIFVIGVLLNWLPFYHWVGSELLLKHWEEVRLMGVLQRIGLAYAGAAILCKYFKKYVLGLSLSLLISYWALCLIFGSADIYSLEGWFGTKIDRKILGVFFDSEGLMSTMGSIALVMLGFWASEKLKNLPNDLVFKKFSQIGFGCVSIALVLNYFHPINSKIWSSTYTLITFGLALLLLGALVNYFDVRRRENKLATIFEAFGRNPLLIFVISSFIPEANALIRIPHGDSFLTPLQWFYTNICAVVPGPKENGSLLYALILLVGYGLLAKCLDQKKIYIRV